MISEDVRRQQAAAAPAQPKPSRGSRTLSVLFDPRLVLWNFVLVALSPALFCMKLRRYTKKHAPQEFSLRRLSSETRLKGEERRPHVVFVAASYGEVLLVKRLAEALLHVRPNLRITWAIRDPQTLSEVKSKLPDQSVAIQPFDSAIPVANWLGKVDPDVLVMIERYNFPDLVAGAKKWGSKVVLVNGRAKGAYQKAGGVVRSYYRWVFGSYDSLLFQSSSDLENASALAPHHANVTSTGNIKLDLLGTDIAPERAAMIRKWLAPDLSPILAAGSTDELDEDRFVLDAFVKVRLERDCRLLLAPRSLDRPSALREEIESRGLTVSFRTNLDPTADVHVLDTMGELAYAYSLSTAAYVGGSLFGMGHNMAEPLEWGVPVCYGPRRGHFDSIQKLCEKFGVGFRVSTADQLATKFLELLANPELRQTIKIKSKEMLERERGASERTVKGLLSVLEQVPL
jgi:3-deoxy-D-manno-octulosonic-acid transferase